MSDQSQPIVCIGEAIVDLVCERRLAPGAGPESFVPHPGGALANVAVAISRCGVSAALIGGVGDDRWGKWLRDELAAADVLTDWVASVEGADTPLGIVLFDSEGEPEFQIYGEHIAPTMLASRKFLEPGIGRSSGVVIGSNTMVGPVEREVTRQAIEIAHECGVPVLLDPNFRPNRWTDPATAADFCRELTGGSAVVKCNRIEAKLITGEDDPLDAARMLASFGPRLAVVTDGPGRVVTAGAAEAEYLPPKVDVISPLGAGDAFMGALSAGLHRVGWDFRRVAEVLPGAVAAGAAICGHWAAQS
ncbi:MAG TPA: carbohydrate kinase [Solirubrobacterales bacterium]|nr:carbohydrate kinase [Solirubrobacterales bacterium]